LLFVNTHRPGNVVPGRFSEPHPLGAASDGERTLFGLAFCLVSKTIFLCPHMSGAHLNNQQEEEGVKVSGTIKCREKVMLSGVAVLAVAMVLGGLAVASNMGFKLNYGIMNAINKLLYGSGVSILAATDDNDPPRTTMEMFLHLANQNPAPQNSNMGFKLNIVSLPIEGIEVETPSGKVYSVYQVGDGIYIEGLGLLP